MATLPALAWIGNAAAVLTGAHGDVTHQAQRAGCSRQAAYKHADRVLAAVTDAQHPGPDRQQLLLENQRLRAELDRLRARPTPPLDADAQRCFAATATAMGLSYNQTEELLGLVLGPDRPDRSTIGRWVAQATRQASRVLDALDGLCRPQTHTLCLDEIFFHGRPVLVGVCPHSLAVLLCRKEADRTAATWQRALQPFTALEAVVHDAGSGLCAGIAALDADRRRQGQPPLDDGLDVFHSEQEAQRLFGRLWRNVEKQWYAAEEADRQVAQAKAKGRDARGPAARARAAWAKATSAFTRYERWEALHRRAQAALRLFRPDGQLNDRSWAEAELAAVRGELAAGYWKKWRAYLEDGRLLTFLDRLHRRLAEAEARAELRAALVELWRLEHRAGGPGGAAGVALAGVQRALCAKLAADWGASYGRVAAALGGVVRASSAVECVNSVLRMHQGRHRNVSQGLLDLKRLYWNTRAFRSGRRRDQCPYQHLGVQLASYDFWQLLHTDPAQLVRELSTEKAVA